MADRPTVPDDPKPTALATRRSDVRAGGPQGLPLVALRETVIFPEMIVPLQVGREKSVNALNAAVAEGGPIALVTQRQAEQEDINQPGELYDVRQDAVQRRNQYAANPEKVRELRELLTKYKRDGRSTPGAPQPNDAPVGAGAGKGK